MFAYEMFYGQDALLRRLHRRDLRQDRALQGEHRLGEPVILRRLPDNSPSSPPLLSRSTSLSRWPASRSPREAETHPAAAAFLRMRLGRDGQEISGKHPFFFGLNGTASGTQHLPHARFEEYHGPRPLRYGGGRTHLPWWRGRVGTCDPSSAGTPPPTSP